MKFELTDIQFFLAEIRLQKAFSKNEGVRPNTLRTATFPILSTCPMYRVRINNGFKRIKYPQKAVYSSSQTKKTNS
jgi:hypothetical protein